MHSMNTKFLFLSRSSRSSRQFMMLIPAVMLVFMVSCGGVGSDSDYAGVGSGGSGLVDGPVTGFGSVIVNGISYDNLSVPAQVKDSDGTMKNVAIRLGQRVQLKYSGTNLATQIEVLPQLIGPVDGSAQNLAGSSNYEFQMMGQWVRVIVDNADTQNARTQLAGFTTANEVVQGVELEAHGSWLYDNAKSAYVLVATRIEKNTSNSNPVLLSGVAQNVTSNRFRLNSVTGRLINSAAMTAVQEGDLVRVWAKRNDLMASGLMTPMRIDNYSLKNEDLQSADIRRGGLISRVNENNNTVEIEGKIYPFPAGAKRGDYSAGKYALVKWGVKQTQPDQIQVRPISGPVDNDLGNHLDNDLGRSLNLNGGVSNVDWTLDSITFVLRGMRVSAPKNFVPQSCKDAGRGNVYVQITAAPVDFGGRVSITSSAMLRCTTQVNTPSGTINRSGKIASVNRQTLTLTNGLVARWDSNTYIEGGVILRVGADVSLEGYFVGNVLQLKVVELDSSD